MGYSPVVLLTTIVHPIDTGRHPTVPAGFRWAVMLGDGPHSDLNLCANAGWAPTAREAEREGDQNAATATRAMQIAGADARYRGVVHIDSDPIPREGDLLQFV
jgi:hypothetical protein